MQKLLFSFIVMVSFLSVRAQTDSLTEYAGIYVFPEDNVVATVDVTLTDGFLTMSSSAGTSSLTQLAVDSFEIVDFSGTAVFGRNEEKKIVGVHIEAMGYIMDGQKQENGVWIFREYYLPGNLQTAGNKNRLTETR